MNTHATDQNGNVLYRSVRQEPDGTWGANVWWGHHHATTLRRYYYRTRKEARDACISDENTVRHGKYSVGAAD